MLVVKVRMDPGMLGMGFFVTLEILYAKLLPAFKEVMDTPNRNKLDKPLVFSQLNITPTIVL